MKSVTPAVAKRVGKRIKADIDFAVTKSKALEKEIKQLSRRLKKLEDFVGI